MHAEYDFDNECWDEISKPAKSFIEALLKKNPKKRLDVHQAIAHQWLTTEAREVQLNIGENFNIFNKQRKEQMKNFKPEMSVIALNEAKGKLLNHSQ